MRVDFSAPHHEGADTVYGLVGSNHPIAPHQELGTTKIPPRSFLAGAAMRKEEAVHDMAARLVYGALIHGGPAYHEFRQLMHLAHATYKKFEELLETDEKID